MRMFRLRRRPSITTLGTTITLVPMLFVGAALIAISVRSSRNLSQDLGLAMIGQTVDRVNDSVDRYLAQVTRLSDLLTAALENGSIHGGDLNAWRGRIIACLQSNPEIASIGYADAIAGRYVYIVRLGSTLETGLVSGKTGPGKIETVEMSDNGILDSSSRAVSDYRLEGRPWYQQAIASKGPGWTNTYDWFITTRHLAHGRTARGIAYVRSVRHVQATTLPTDRRIESVPMTSVRSATRLGEGRGFERPADRLIDGVLAIDVNLAEIDAYLAEIAAPLGASLIMSDGNGRIVGSSETTLDSHWPDVAGTDGEVAHALAAHFRTNGRLSLMRGSDRRPTLLTINGRIFWATELRLPVSPTAHWNLLVAIPEQPIITRAKADIRRSIGIGCIYVAVAAALSVVMARALARPFRRLASFAHDIGAGHFDQRIQVSTTREVAELSDALNGMAAALRERLALQTARDAAEASGAVKARLIAHVSHEFRTPLNAIVGYSELLKDAANDQGRIRDASDASNILFASGHLLRLVENLLDLSRAEAGRLRLDLAEFSIADLVDNIVGTMRPIIERNGNVLHVVRPPADGPNRMISDAARIQQILINVLGNAAKFTENGTVTFSGLADSGGNHVVFEICDTGIGIDLQHLPHVFEPFMQVHLDRPGRKREGAGLGLAISRQVCELLGGTIELTSAVLTGTRVVVTLPRVHPTHLVEISP